MSWNENHIKTLEIQNFKSIKQLNIDCNRINLFVGKPNVGKSNILEALSLKAIFPLSLPEQIDLLIRNDIYGNLFFDSNTTKSIEIIIDKNKTKFGLHKRTRMPVITGDSSKISPYYFSKKNPAKIESNQSSPKLLDKSILQYPHGKNLISVIQQNKQLRETIASYFTPYGLEFLVDGIEEKIEIIKRKDGLAFKIPYELMADTLQRMIFYMAAILSNENAVLIFEEPEAHAYPPFIKQFSEKLLESETNQFFLATHNPYILNTLLENDKNNEVNLFLVDYLNHQTVARLIGEEEKQEMLSYGIDIFFNERWFQYDA